MSALDDNLLWPGCFGGGGPDWEIEGKVEAVAALVVKDLAANPKLGYGCSLSAMQLVDWHCDRGLSLPVSVIEALAAALRVGDHLHKMEAITLSTQEVPRKKIGRILTKSLRTVDRWRSAPDFASYTDDPAFGRFAVRPCESSQDLVDEVTTVSRHCSNLRGDPKRGDDYPAAARQRLLEIVLWFSGRREPLPNEVWLAIACALGLATYRGSLRNSIHERRSPEKYHFAVLADTDVALADWERRVATSELQPAGKFPILAEMDFMSDKALAKLVGIDRKTLARWRNSAAYKLARFVNILAVRRGETNNPIGVSREEHRLLADLVSQVQCEHEADQEQRALKGRSSSAIRPPRLRAASRDRRRSA